MTEPDETANEPTSYDAEAYDADHDPVEDVPEAETGAGEDTILGSGQPQESGEEYISLTQETSRETEVSSEE